jgi:cellulose synthase (UDP-forming)
MVDARGAVRGAPTGRHVATAPAPSPTRRAARPRHLAASAHVLDETGTRWPTPPTDEEKVRYLAAGQHRWIFVVSAVAFAGVAASLGGLAARTTWTAVFALPLLVLLVEQAVSLRTSTVRRRVTLPDHQFVVETYGPEHYPSVDVFLPCAGEDVGVIANTYRWVQGLTWPGRLVVTVLDDAADPRVQDLALSHGFRYLARPGSAFKKAGNLQYGFERSDCHLIAIFDADFAARHDFLFETVPYLQDPDVGIVQTPQYFSAHRGMRWLERCAGATQELFFRHIQPSRDAVGAAICVGTSAVYRRTALDAIGGFPLIGHSEDVFTGVLMARHGYRLQYVPVLLSRGRCPDTVPAFLAQQYRWCEGSMALLSDRSFHEEPTMTRGQRLSFWAGFLYYVTTAAAAVVAPLPLLVMLYAFPDGVSAVDMLPLVGVLPLWFVVLPRVSQARWRVDVLRVQTLYAFAHLFCIVDAARGRVVDWVATGARRAPRTSVAHRVRRFMVPYLVITQALIGVGLARGVLSYGIGAYWATLGFALIGAYITLPVAWAAWRDGRNELRSVPGVTDVADAPRELVLDLRDSARVHAKEQDLRRPAHDADLQAAATVGR